MQNEKFVFREKFTLFNIKSCVFRIFFPILKRFFVGEMLFKSSIKAFLKPANEL